MPTIKLNIPQLARLGLFSRSTKNVVAGVFSHNTQFAFGQGCDQPGYVNAKNNFTFIHRNG